MQDSIPTMQELPNDVANRRALMQQLLKKTEYIREYASTERCYDDDALASEAIASLYSGPDGKPKLSRRMGEFMLRMMYRGTWGDVRDLTNLYQKHFGDRELYDPFKVAASLFDVILPGYDADCFGGVTTVKNIPADTGILLQIIYKNMPCMRRFIGDTLDYLKDNEHYPAYFQAITDMVIRVDGFGRTNVVKFWLES